MNNTTIPALPEHCKPIPDFPGYCAHPDGHILSCHKNKWGYADTWRKLKSGSNNKYGRQIVVLVDALGKQHSVHVHRVILAAFVGPCPPGMEACHDNGNAGDNRLENLRWDTHDANIEDMKAHGMKKGERHPLATLTDDLVREIRQRSKNGETAQAIANDLGLQRRNVSKVIDRTRWGHVV